MGSELPPPLPGNAPNGAEHYYRRRIDELVDRRLATIEEQVNTLDSRLDRLDRRLSYLFGALALLSFLGSVAGPALIHALFGI